MKVKDLIEALKTQNPSDMIVVRADENGDNVEYQEARLISSLRIVFSQRLSRVVRGHQLNDPEFVEDPEDEKIATPCIVIDI